MNERKGVRTIHDPRTTPGELWWPERFGRAEIEDLKRSLGAYGSAGQLQQRPSPAIGGMFKRHWWRFWQPVGVNLEPVPVKQPDGRIQFCEPLVLPPLDEQLHSWDMSYRDLKESDYVVGQHWGRSGSRKFLLHQIKGRWDFSRAANEFRAFAEQYSVPLKLVENAANGPAIIWALETQISGIVPVVPSGSKEARAAACSPQVEAGNIFLPHPSLAPWVAEFIEECAQFPMGAHDDQVDAMSQALARLTQGEVYRLLPEFRAHHLPGEPTEACHVIGGDKLEDWWPRWVSVGTVARQGSAIHWYCQTPSGQVHIYREALCAGSAEEAGVALAQGSLGELQHTQGLSVFLTRDVFDGDAASKSFAAELRKGIEKIVGRDAKPIFGLTDGELRLPGDLASAAVQDRARQIQLGNITLRAVSGDRAGGWEHIRGLLRWSPITASENTPYDRGAARRILEEQGQAAMDEYLRQVEGGSLAEPLPRLRIWESCRQLIESLAGTLKDERRFDTATASPFSESILAGLMGHRENPEIRPPLEAFTAERLDQLRKRVPNPSAMQVHMAAQKAEADWKKRYGSRKGLTFSRLPRRIR